VSFGYGPDNCNAEGSNVRAKFIAFWALRFVIVKTKQCLLGDVKRGLPMEQRH